MVDDNDKLYRRNLVRLITAKHRSYAKWCGQHGGVVYFFSTSFTEKDNLSLFTYGGLSGWMFVHAISQQYDFYFNSLTCFQHFQRMLSADFWCLKTVSTQVKRKNPGNNWWSSAWDAKVPSQGPLELWLQIGSHWTSATEASNMTGMANQAYWPWRELSVMHMCCPCCRLRSSLVVQSSWPANIRHDNLSTCCALD